MFCVFIVNSKVGDKDKRILMRKMESAFRMSESFFVKEEVTQKGDAQQFARKYAEKYGDNCLIVACGGDETVHDVVNGIYGTKASLLVLPFGNDNDFAKKIYDSRKLDLQKIMKRFNLLNGSADYDIMPIDLMNVNGNKCVNVMSFGFDTKVEALGHKLAQNVPKLGSQAYNVALAGCVFTNMKYKINVNLETIDMYGNKGKINKVINYTLLAICNGSYYGGFCPAINSKLDDGIFDLCYIDEINVLEALSIIPAYLKGNAYEKFASTVHMLKVTSGTLSSVDESELMGEYDGEKFTAKTVSFKILPKSLNLCVFKD